MVWENMGPPYPVRNPVPSVGDGVREFTIGDWVGTAVWSFVGMQVGFWNAHPSWRIMEPIRVQYAWSGAGIAAFGGFLYCLEGAWGRLLGVFPSDCRFSSSCERVWRARLYYVRDLSVSRTGGIVPRCVLFAVDVSASRQEPAEVDGGARAGVGQAEADHCKGIVPAASSRGVPVCRDYGNHSTNNL